MLSWQPVEVLAAVIMLEAVGIVAGLIAVSAMVYGSVLLLHETRIAVRVIGERTTTIRRAASNEVNR